MMSGLAIDEFFDRAYNKDTYLEDLRILGMNPPSVGSARRVSFSNRSRLFLSQRQRTFFHPTKELQEKL